MKFLKTTLIWVFVFLGMYGLFYLVIEWVSGRVFEGMSFGP
jgi:hypothetical protein